MSERAMSRIQHPPFSRAPNSLFGNPPSISSNDCVTPPARIFVDFSADSGLVTQAEKYA